MLSRYSHVRMEAERRAFDEIAARQRAADEKRKGAERQQAVVLSRVAVIQQPPLAGTSCGTQSRHDYRRCPPPPADRLPEDPEFPPE